MPDPRLASQLHAVKALAAVVVEAELRIDIWMPLYIGDYLADTIDLTNAEHGAYLRSIMMYWRKGGSLTPKELRAVCGKEIDRVNQFFIMDEGLWHHKRVDQELDLAHKRKLAAEEKARKSIDARRRAGLLPPE